MGWCTVKNLETGETKFYGDAPVQLKNDLPVEDPTHNLRKAANWEKLRNATDQDHDDCVFYGKQSGLLPQRKWTPEEIEKLLKDENSVWRNM